MALSAEEEDETLRQYAKTLNVSSAHLAPSYKKWAALALWEEAAIVALRFNNELD